MTWQERLWARKHRLLAGGLAGGLAMVAIGWWISRPIVVHNGTLILAEGVDTADPDLLYALLANLTADDVMGEG